MKTSIFTALIATGVVCAALLLAGMALAAPLLRAIRTPSNTFRDSITYLKIYTAALPFVFFYNVTNGIFSALGDSQTPFLFLVVSSCANVALDILFVARLGMKVSGVGWATFLCQGAACIPAAIVLVKKIKKLEAVRLRRSNGRCCGNLCAWRCRVCCSRAWSPLETSRFRALSTFTARR